MKIKSIGMLLLIYQGTFLFLLDQLVDFLFFLLLLLSLFCSRCPPVFGLRKETDGQKEKKDGKQPLHVHLFS